MIRTYTLQEVMRISKLSISTLYRDIKKGELIAYKLKSGQYNVLKEDLDNYIKERNKLHERT